MRYIKGIAEILEGEWQHRMDPRSRGMGISMLTGTLWMRIDSTPLTHMPCAQGRTNWEKSRLAKDEEACGGGSAASACYHPPINTSGLGTGRYD